MQSKTEERASTTSNLQPEDGMLSSVFTICTLLYNAMLRHAFRNIYLKIVMELMFISMTINKVNPRFAATSTCGK